MWVDRGGPPERPVVWFQYADTRSGTVPRQFLFPGGVPPAGCDPPPQGLYLLTDGYSGYRALALEVGIRGHAACWAHVRRTFVEAAEGRKNTAAAHQMVALIGQLYAVERRLRTCSADERQAERQAHSRPILEKIKAWLEAKVAHVLPKGLLGTAIGYALGLWPQLTTFLEDGHIPIDNNVTENAIRPFVVGPQGLAVQWQSPRRSGQRHTLLPHRDGQGQRARAPRLPQLPASSACPRLRRPRQSRRSCPKPSNPKT